MYLITGGVGFLACVIFIVLIVILALRGKSCTIPLIGFILSVVLFLGSGFLYSRTDPEIGGIRFLEYVTEDRTVPPNLEGEWKETVDKDTESYHGIYISGDTIEIYWSPTAGNPKPYTGPEPLCRLRTARSRIPGSPRTIPAVPPPRCWPPATAPRNLPTATASCPTPPASWALRRLSGPSGSPGDSLNPNSRRRNRPLMPPPRRRPPRWKTRPPASWETILQPSRTPH